MRDYVDNQGTGRNFTPSELELMAAVGVEYYHRRVCGCGAEVLHDGMRADCRECSELSAGGGQSGLLEEEFKCAECRPYVYADLLQAGRLGPVTLSRMDLLWLGLVVFGVGVGVGWWICR